MEELLTPQQLAALLQITVSSIRELCRHRTQVRSKNPLPHFKIHGKAVRFRRSDVEQWLATCAAQSVANGRWRNTNEKRRRDNLEESANGLFKAGCLRDARDVQR